MNRFILNPAGWVFAGKVNEARFVDDLLKQVPIFCVNDSLYESDGTLIDINFLKQGIMENISPYVATNLSTKIKSIIDTIKIVTYTAPPKQTEDRIHLQNGTLYLEDGFTEEKEFTLNRLPVPYNPYAPEPVQWLSFIHELFDDEDIPTLQEFMGYCFIPTNKGQKMLMMIGNGGEGKSRIGVVMRSLLGGNMNSASVADLEKDKFARANLVGKLLLFDDDMAMEALSDTHILKTLITLDGYTEVERKGIQSYQALIYARIMSAGNGTLSALHDRSNGFYRRQLILTVKPKNPDRVDDPYLSEKLFAEKEGILLWCLEGLRRLIRNDYEFTVSKKTLNNLKEAMEESNNVISFLKSEGYVRIEPGTFVTGKALYRTYSTWCDDNDLKPLSAKSFTGYLKQQSGTLGIEYTNSIDAGGGKKVRGYRGIHTKIRTGM